MKQSNHGSRKSRGDRGIAVLLLLFAMSAFSVLGVAALTTDMGAAPPGQSFSIFQGLAEGNLTKFVAPIVVPNAWRVQGSNGSYAFQLPVVVPESSGEPGGSTAAWHVMTETEVPGLEVCCESRAGSCAQRKMDQQAAHIEEWNPGADDALRVSLNVATVISGAAVAPDAAPIACQLEFQGAVIGKGIAYLRQTPREDRSGLSSDLIEGRFDIAVRIR